MVTTACGFVCLWCNRCFSATAKASWVARWGRGGTRTTTSTFHQDWLKIPAQTDRSKFKKMRSQSEHVANITYHPYQCHQQTTTNKSTAILTHPLETRQLGEDSGQLSIKSEEGRNFSQLLRNTRIQELVDVYNIHTSIQFRKWWDDWKNAESFGWSFCHFVMSHLVSIRTAFVTLQCVGQTKEKHDPVVHLDQRFVRIKI